MNQDQVRSILHGLIDLKMSSEPATSPIDENRLKAVEEKQKQLMEALGVQAFHIQNLQEALAKEVPLDPDKTQDLQDFETAMQDIAQRQALQETRWQTLADETMKDHAMFRLSLFGVHEAIKEQQQVLDSLQSECADVEQLCEGLDNHRVCIEELQHCLKEVTSKHNILDAKVNATGVSLQDRVNKLAEDSFCVTSTLSDLQALVKEIAVDQRNLTNRYEAIEKKQIHDKMLIDSLVNEVANMLKTAEELSKREESTREGLELLCKLVSQNSGYIAKTEAREERLISRIESLEAKIQSMQNDELLDGLSSALA